MDARMILTGVIPWLIAMLALAGAIFCMRRVRTLVDQMRRLELRFESHDSRLTGLDALCDRVDAKTDAIDRRVSAWIAEVERDK